MIFFRQLPVYIIIIIARGMNSHHPFASPPNVPYEIHLDPSQFCFCAKHSRFMLLFCAVFSRLFLRDCFCAKSTVLPPVAQSKKKHVNSLFLPRPSRITVPQSSPDRTRQLFAPSSTALVSVFCCQATTKPCAEALSQTQHGCA